jgi:hypothetical protein
MASDEPTDNEVIEQIQNTAGPGARFSPGAAVWRARCVLLSWYIQADLKTMLKPSKFSLVHLHACIQSSCIA